MNNLFKIIVLFCFVQLGFSQPHIINPALLKQAMATDGQALIWSDANDRWEPGNVASSGGAPSDATYITQTPNGDLSSEQALSTLATGILKNTTTTGVLSIAIDADFPSTLSRDSESPAAGDITGSLSAGYTVGDDSHAHTTTTISGLDISDDTNFAVSSPITLTGDTVGFNASANFAWSGQHRFTPATSFIETLPYSQYDFSINAFHVFRPSAFDATEVTTANVSSIVDMSVSDLDNVEHQGFYSYVKTGSSAQTGSIANAYDFLIDVQPDSNEGFVYGLRGNINKFNVDATLHSFKDLIFSFVSGGSKKVGLGIYLAGSTTSNQLVEGIHINTKWEQYGFHISQPTAPATGYAGVFFDANPALFGAMSAPGAAPAGGVYVYGKTGTADILCTAEDNGVEACIQDYGARTTEPFSCSNTTYGAKYFDTNDQTLCICANDGADEWQKVTDMTTDCSI